MSLPRLASATPESSTAPAPPGSAATSSIEQGRIAAVGPRLPADDAETVEAGGRYLAPGFIDAHATTT